MVFVRRLYSAVNRIRNEFYLSVMVMANRFALDDQRFLGKAEDGGDWWAANDPALVVRPPNNGMPRETGGVAGTGNTVGGKFAGLSPQAAWETAKNELGYTGSTPQDQGTLQRIADYLAQNGAPGFKA